MHVTEYPYAGLILPDARDLDPRPYLQAARRVLARLDPHPSGGSRLNEATNMVLGGVFGLRVTAQEFSDYGPRMMLEVVSQDGTPTKDEAAAQILSDTVLVALKKSSADIIEWYSPDVLLDADDFIRLRSYVSPKRVKSAALHTPRPEQQAPLILMDAVDGTAPDRRDTMPALYDTPEPHLEHPVMDGSAEDAPSLNTPRRPGAFAWAIRAVLAIVTLPMGVARFIVDLFRGVEFRLISQVVAVTALFALLYSTDRLHSVLRQFLY